MKTYLLSTINDPQGKMYEPIKCLFPQLVEIYDGVVISITDKTHPAIIDVIGQYGSIGPTIGMANGRRRVLGLGLETDADHFHYCDFDRIIYWVAHHPDHLKRLINDAKGVGSLIILERSKAAWESHPLLQRLTEWVINKKHSNGRYADFLTGSRIIPRQMAVEILARSKATNGAAVDIEWPMIIGLDRVIYLRVEGLDYEHKFLGLEKPFTQEIKVRLDNMISGIKVNVTR